MTSFRFAGTPVVEWHGHCRPCVRGIEADSQAGRLGFLVREALHKPLRESADPNEQGLAPAHELDRMNLDVVVLGDFGQNVPS